MQNIPATAHEEFLWIKTMNVLIWEREENVNVILLENLHD